MPTLAEIKHFTEMFDPYGDSVYPPEYVEWLIRAAERAEDAPAGWRTEIMALLEQHRGETGADEDALEVAQRLSRFWRENHP